MKKPNLSFWQVWNMSFGFLGIQFGFALQNANVSRIFETLGASKDEIPILWLAAPVTGLLVQPIIGYMSDRTWNKLGRRKPYFLIGAILASLALVIMPNSPTLWIAAGTLWLMDGSINISMEPFRALVGDMLPSEQRTVGFAVQSFFIGIGAVVASALPYILTNWFDVSNIARKGEIPDSVAISFYLGAAAFLLAVVWTVIKTKEYPPEMLDKFEGGEEDEAQSASIKDFFADFLKIPKTMKQLALVQFFSWFALFSMWIYTTTAVTSHVYDLKLTPEFTEQLSQKLATLPTDSNDEKTTKERQKVVADLETLKMKFVAGSKEVAADMQTISFFIDKLADENKLLDNFNNIFSQIKSDSEASIKVEKKLAELKEIQEKDPDKVNVDYDVVSFFANSDKLSNINNELASQLTLVAPLKYVQKEYNTGAEFVGICFAAYSLFSAIFAFLLPTMASKIGRKRTHAISLVGGALGLASVYFISSPNMLYFSMIGIGLAWASILSMPYAMLAGSVPAKKMGVYMGIFNFFIVIPQILAASVLGFLMTNFFGGEAVYSLVLGGAAMLLAALLTLLVDDKDDVAVAEKTA